MIHLPTIDCRTALRAFSSVLEGIQRDGTINNFHDVAFQRFSIMYNKALQDGEYEVAVACLMLMRLIRKEEHGAVCDAAMLAEIAKEIINTEMR